MRSTISMDLTWKKKPIQAIKMLNGGNHEWKISLALLCLLQYIFCGDGGNFILDIKNSKRELFIKYPKIFGQKIKINEYMYDKYYKMYMYTYRPLSTLTWTKPA